MIREMGSGRSRKVGEDEPEPSGYSETTPRRKVVAPTNQLCGITDVGQVRDHNEDAFYLSEDGRLLLVADGMGGHEAGEVASALAIEAAAQFVTADQSKDIDAGVQPFEPLLMGALGAAHRKVIEASVTPQGRRDMGSALILAYLKSDRLYTCHVGDVRCYVLWGSTFQQITRDHSVVGALVQSGQLTPEEARVHPKKNEILQAIGMPSGVVPEVNTRPLANGDRVLLCSDGLWEALPEAEIRSIVEWEGTMRQLATQLVDRANDAGGFDNITVVLYGPHCSRGSDQPPKRSPKIGP
jgi:protein phosphatase